MSSRPARERRHGDVMRRCREVAREEGRRGIRCDCCETCESSEERPPARQIVWLRRMRRSANACERNTAIARFRSPSQHCRCSASRTKALVFAVIARFAAVDIARHEACAGDQCVSFGKLACVTWQASMTPPDPDAYVGYRTDGSHESTFHSRMSELARIASSPALQAAFLRWEDAVRDLVAEINRLATGGRADAAALEHLKYAVETCRSECERLTVSDPTAARAVEKP